MKKGLVDTCNCHLFQSTLLCCGEGPTLSREGPTLDKSYVGG